MCNLSIFKSISRLNITANGSLNSIFICRTHMWDFCYLLTQKKAIIIYCCRQVGIMKNFIVCLWSLLIKPQNILHSLINLQQLLFPRQCWIWSPSWEHWARGRRVQPGCDTSPLQSTMRTLAHTHTYLGATQCSQINLPELFWTFFRNKPENPGEKTHGNMGKTCKTPTDNK